MKIQLTKEQEALLFVAGKIVVTQSGREFLRLPYWYEKLGPGHYDELPWDKLPAELRDGIWKKRELPEPQEQLPATTTRYYLMGETAVQDFERGGMPELLHQMKERKSLDGQLFAFEEHTSVHELIDAVDGWGEVIELFPHQYTAISKLEEELNSKP